MSDRPTLSASAERISGSVLLPSVNASTVATGSGTMIVASVMPSGSRRWRKFCP